LRPIPANWENRALTINALFSARTLGVLYRVNEHDRLVEASRLEVHLNSLLNFIDW